MKKILIGVAVVAVLIAGGVIYFASNIDSIIKAAVEDVGSRATKTTVSLSGVELSISSGAGALKGFNMTNPSGFKTERAMRFGEVRVKVDTGSVGADVIRIREVVIAAPEITYELAGGTSNIQTIQKNVDAFAKSMGAGGGGAKPAAGSKEGGKKVVIDNLYVRNGKIGVSAEFLAGKQLNVPLPTIHLKDIGKKEGGASPAQVADQLLTEISRSATGAVSGLGLDRMMDKVKDMGGGATKIMEGAGSGAGKALDDAGKGVGGALKGVFGK